MNKLLLVMIISCSSSIIANEDSVRSLNISSQNDLFSNKSLVFIEGGCFLKGDLFEEGLYNEKLVRRCIDDFYINEHEVTQRQWISVMNSNPSKDLNCGLDCPVENVSWNEIQVFLDKLRNITKLNYRLPTESQWEFAARDRGNKVRFGNGKNVISYNNANFDSNIAFKKEYSLSPSKYIHLKNSNIKRFDPNQLGIFDLSGNISEWTEDWYHDQSYMALIEKFPDLMLYGKFKVIKGGSWYEPPFALRNSYRRFSKPEGKNEMTGFRLALHKDNFENVNANPTSKEKLIIDLFRDELKSNKITPKLISDFDLSKVNAYLYPNIEIDENLLKKLKKSFLE